MMDADGICGVSERILKILAKQRERDRDIYDDENVNWRNVDANFLLDIKYKY
jgi:hypothetical protein